MTMDAGTGPCQGPRRQWAVGPRRTHEELAMSPVLRTLAALAATGLLALAGTAARAERVGAYHVMPTPEGWQKLGRAAPSADTAGSVLYYGGQVIAQPKVISVMWGGSVRASTVAGIPGFSQALVNSSYVDQMAQYDTFLRAQDGRRGTKQHIVRGSYLGQVQITPANTKKSITNDEVVAEVKGQIAAGVLPVQDANTLYMIYFPADVSITLDGMTSCVHFGAYHFASKTRRIKPDNIFYSVEPDCGYSFNTITFIAAHEFVEAVTDAIPTPGTNPAYPQAWNTAGGYEVADLCSNSGQLVAGAKTYSVSQYYLNSTGACSTGNYTSP